MLGHNVPMFQKGTALDFILRCSFLLEVKERWDYFL